MADYQVGSMVRVIRVPPYLYLDAEHASIRETIAIFELCLESVKKVFQPLGASLRTMTWTIARRTHASLLWAVSS
jgi:hypothetical protein